MSPETALSLDPTGSRMGIELTMLRKVAHSPDWAKGLRIDLDEGMIYSWSDKERVISLFTLPKGELITTSSEMVPEG